MRVSRVKKTKQKKNKLAGHTNVMWPAKVGTDVSQYSENQNLEDLYILKS